MSSSTISTNSLECEIIDKEITRLLEAVRQLRSRRNTLIPISRLPPEVLTHIFKFVQKGWSAGMYIYSWTAVTRVSQRWRTISHSAQNLWTQIDYSSSILRSKPRAVEVFLEHSGHSLPLTVYILDDGYRALDVVHPLLAQLSRITDLDLSLRNWDDKFYEALGKPAPLLEVCNLHGFEKSLSAPSQTRPLLFAGEAPHLTTLTIDEFHVNLEGFIAKNLTFMRVWFETATNGIPIPAFLGLLSHAESLRTLDLSHAFYVPDNTTRSSLPLAILPNLEILKLDANRHEIQTLLSRLVISPTSRVQIDVRIPEAFEHPPIPQQFLDFLGTRLDRALTFKEVAIFGGELCNYNLDPYLRYAFWTSEHPIEDTYRLHGKHDYDRVRDRENNLSDVAISIDFLRRQSRRGRDEDDPTWEWLVEPRKFNMSEVTHLRLRFLDPSYHNDMGYPQPNFETIFASFPSLTSLLVDGKHVINAFSAFISIPTAGQGPTSASMGVKQVPLLERLSVHLSVRRDRRNVEVLERLYLALRGWTQLGGRRVDEFVLVGQGEEYEVDSEEDVSLRMVYQGISSLVDHMRFF